MTDPIATKDAQGPKRMPRTAAIAAGVLAAAAALLVGAGALGYWAARAELLARIDRFLAFRLGWATAATSAANATWRPQNTLLVRLETSEVWLPGAEGSGGGIHPIDEQRILYATRSGGFGLVGPDGFARALPFRIDLNSSELERHPVYKAKDFNRATIRVTDIDVRPIEPGRYELLVGHHWFDAERQCVELRLSRATMRAVGNEFALEESFRTVMAARPCITFFLEGDEWAFEGHISGGRIARLDASRALFSTGDHGWSGLRGYPALAQDDESTLGKILLVELATGKTTVYAKGVRNPQGLVVDSRGQIWETEHGPRGGDELNRVVRGANFGWPHSTYGTDYGPRPWPLASQQGQHATDVRPSFAWAASIGVSDLIEARGDEFPLWRGDLLVASLAGHAVHRLRLEGERVVYDEAIAFGGDRLRDIAELPSGRLALLTDRGTLLLVRNADRSHAPPYLDAARQQRRTADMPVAEREIVVAGRFASVQRAGTLDESAAERELPGAHVFQRHCAGCHSGSTLIAQVGPTLKGVVGRRVGATPYAYSAALLGRSDVWTTTSIVEFASDPSALYPGTTMGEVQLSDGDRAELRKYFASVTAGVAVTAELGRDGGK